jgi:hypothetical protein
MNILKYTRNVSLWLALIVLLSGCAQDEEVWRCYDRDEKREKDHLLVTINRLSESVFIEEFDHTFGPVLVGNSTIGFKELPPEFEITNEDFSDSKIVFSPNTIAITGKYKLEKKYVGERKHEINLENKTMTLSYTYRKWMGFAKPRGEMETSHTWYRCETKLF